MWEIDSDMIIIFIDIDVDYGSLHQLWSNLTVESSSDSHSIFIKSQQRSPLCTAPWSLVIFFLALWLSSSVFYKRISLPAKLSPADHVLPVYL